VWKQTIDTLGGILGHLPALRWAALDGRIIELGLYCTLNHAIGNDVIIAIMAAGTRASPPAVRSALVGEEAWLSAYPASQVMFPHATRAVIGCSR
jgi:hypothetical protein